MVNAVILPLDKHHNNSSSLLKRKRDASWVVRRVMENAEFSAPSTGNKLVQGLKRTNEDAMASVPDLFSSKTAGMYHFYGVFDGHGGGEVSEYCASNMHAHLLNHLLAAREVCSGESASQCGSCHDCHQREQQSLVTAMSQAFQTSDASVAASVSNVASCGSTACAAVVTDTAIVVANCGDSRAVIVRGGKVVPVSHDHRPNRQDEVDRVLAKGGQILWNSGARVMGILGCTRSIGDRDLQPYGISPIPEMYTVPRTPEDEFLILATDGVWNVVDSDAVCGMIMRCLKRAADKNATRASAFRMAADAAGRMAKDKGSKDDIAVILVDLVPPPLTQQAWQYGPIVRFAHCSDFLAAAALNGAATAGAAFDDPSSNDAVTRRRVQEGPSNPAPSQPANASAPPPPAPASAPCDAAAAAPPPPPPREDNASAGASPDHRTDSVSSSFESAASQVDTADGELSTSKAPPAGERADADASASASEWSPGGTSIALFQKFHSSLRILLDLRLSSSAQVGEAASKASVSAALTPTGSLWSQKSVPSPPLLRSHSLSKAAWVGASRGAYGRLVKSTEL